MCGKPVPYLPPTAVAAPSFSLIECVTTEDRKNLGVYSLSSCSYAWWFNYIVVECIVAEVAANGTEQLDVANAEKTLYEIWTGRTGNNWKNS